MAGLDKDQTVNMLQKVFMPAAYDTFFTKYRIAFFVIGVILVFMGFSSVKYFWLGVISLVIFLLMMCGSLMARKSMLQKLSNIGRM